MDIENRFNRILSIFIQLQSKSIVRAQDLAERYEVSNRTIYRDIKALENAGVPIYSEAGVGYSLASGYKLPPALFTQDEAMSFAVAEKIMQKNVDKNLAQNFSNALSKMRAVLRNEQKEQVETLDNSVWLGEKGDVFNDAVPNAIAVLLAGIAAKKQVTIDYKKFEQDHIGKREIEPIGVFQEFDYWYVMAYCNLRNDIRQFRVDRIHKITATDIPMVQKLKSLQHYLATKSEKVSPLEVVYVRVNLDVRKYMDREKKLFGFKEETKDDDGYTMQFYYNPNYNYLIRWLSMYADSVQIIKPLSVRKEMLAYLKEAYEKMRTLK